jgi:hypothetical protein
MVINKCRPASLRRWEQSIARTSQGTGANHTISCAVHAFFACASPSVCLSSQTAASPRALRSDSQATYSCIPTQASSLKRSREKPARASASADDGTALRGIDGCAILTLA